MLLLIMWHNRFSENENEAVETYTTTSRIKDQKARTSRFQDQKTTTSRFQGQKATTSNSCEILTLMPPDRFHWDMSLFRWRVTVSGELMFWESYGNRDVTNTITLFL